MAFIKPSTEPKEAGKSNMTLLKGLAIVALIGIVAAVILNQFVA